MNIPFLAANGPVGLAVDFTRRQSFEFPSSSGNTPNEEGMITGSI